MENNAVDNPNRLKSRIFKEIFAKQRTEEEAKKTFIVRDYKDGGPISRTVETEEGSIWAPNISTKRRSEKGFKSENFTVIGKQAVGAPLTFGGRFYQVAQTENKVYAEKWGENSVFVKPISAEEYESLLSEVNP